MNESVCKSANESAAYSISIQSLVGIRLYQFIKQLVNDNVSQWVTRQIHSKI